jgi:hypothetical protein
MVSLGFHQASHHLNSRSPAPAVHCEPAENIKIKHSGWQREEKGSGERTVNSFNHSRTDRKWKVEPCCLSRNIERDFFAQKMSQKNLNS